MNKTDLSASIKKKMSAYSPFQQAVWKACATIPKGQVRTYGWVARQIGRPKSARAVGAALGANPFAPTIPCHRVVAANGKLGGYSGPGGLPQKKKMLIKEGAIPKGNKVIR